ncbi:MAG: hypothetical protein R3E77_05330 [Steroidobacteraceae bacterium]
MRNRVASFVAAGLYLVSVHMATPVTAAPSSSDLDNAEQLVCGRNQFLKGTMAAAEQDQGKSVPIGQAAPGAINDPARRATAQRVLDSNIRAAQAGQVENARRALAESQAEYQNLTGHTFDTSKCDGGRVRLTHAAQDRQRHEAEQATLIAARDKEWAAGTADQFEAARRSRACDARKSLDSNPNYSGSFRPGVPESARIRFESEAQQLRKTYENYAQQYQREHGRAFDPATGCQN